MELVEKIHDQGQSLFVFPLKVYYLANDGSVEDRLVISVPKRIFKRAVKRNLVRRRVREAFRLNKEAFPGYKGKDILVVYTSSEIFDYAKVTESVKAVLEKIS